MAERVIQATATIPAGTPSTAPVTVALPFDGWEVEAIELEVPAGPAGTMAFYLANNGQWWIPRTPGQFLVWDDKRETYYLSGNPTAGGWQIIGYNLGDYDHAVTVRFHVNPLSGPDLATVPLVLTFIEHGVKERDPVTL